MFGSLPKSVQHQVLNNPVALAPMFSLVLFMVHGRTIVLVRNFSRRYNRIHVNHLDDQVME